MAVRILQKAKNFYRNLKFKTLSKLLSFYGDENGENWAAIESLVYECNREGLVKTVVDHRSGSISFDKQVEVLENLMQFGTKLRQAFITTREVTYAGHHDERNRIFMKVKEKIDEEKKRIDRLRQNMLVSIEDNVKREEEERVIREQKLVEEKRKQQAEFDARRKKNEEDRKVNDILEKLRVQRQLRAKEVLYELAQKGFKKINKDKIDDLIKNEKEEIEYDTVMSFYQSVLQKEREAFEEQKKQKRNTVEIWAHAIKMEEAKALGEYCKKYGQRDVEQIQKAIEERHQRERETKQKLVSAVSAFDKFKQGELDKRAIDHKEKQIKFRDKLAMEVKEQIMEFAKRQVQILKIKEQNRLAAEARLARDKRIQDENRKRALEEGRNPDEKDDENSGWGRGSGIEEARENQRRIAERDAQRQQQREGGSGLGGGFQRGDFKRKTEESPRRDGGRSARDNQPEADGPGFGFRNTNAGRSNQEEQKRGGGGGRPMFTNSGKDRAQKEEGGQSFGFRSNNASAKSTAEAPKTGGPSKGGPPQFTRGGGTGNRGSMSGTRGGGNAGGGFARNTAPKSGGDGGFSR